jgi:hypothetical protein
MPGGSLLVQIKELNLSVENKSAKEVLKELQDEIAQEPGMQNNRV